MRQPLFPLNQQVYQYLKVFKTIFPFSFLLASFERNVLFYQILLPAGCVFKTVRISYYNVFNLDVLRFSS